MRFRARGFFSVAIVVSIVCAACSTKSTPTSPSTTTPPTCTYTISTTNFSMSGAGGSATFTVTTGAGCAWTVSTTGNFVTVSTPTSQTGSGPVSFSVPENPGDTRTATLTVAGQTVAISQSPNDQVYGNWSGTITKGSGCPASLPASLEWTGAIRRTSTGANELAISIPSLAVSQTLPIIISGNNIQFTVALDALYTFTATLSSDRRSLTGTFSGGSCSGTWSGARR